MAGFNGGFCGLLGDGFGTATWGIWGVGGLWGWNPLMGVGCWVLGEGEARVTSGVERMTNCFCKKRWWAGLCGEE